MSNVKFGTVFDIRSYAYTLNNIMNWELKNYWEDGVTIECRYFPTKKAAKAFAISEGYSNYKIVKL